MPGQRSSWRAAPPAAARPPARGRHLYGQQPPYESRDSIGSEPPDVITPPGEQGTERQAQPDPYRTTAGHGSPADFDPLAGARTPAEFVPPPGFGPPGGFGSALPPPPGPADPYGTPGGQGPDAGHGSAGEHIPPESYGVTAGYTAEPFVAEAYGPPGGYGSDDGYGYGPARGYLPPDPYLSGQSYFPPDLHGSPDPYAPTADGPAVSRGLHAAPAPAPHPPAAPAPAPRGPGPLTPGDPIAVLPRQAAHGATRDYSPRDGLAGGQGDPARPQEHAESTESLTPEFLLPGRRRAPSPGWRRVLYHASAGLLRVPESAAELRRRDMISRIRTPVAGGHHRVAVLSLKGGVGKTTTTVGLGSTLASLRGDRVIAVDANPDRGTLSDKVRLETAATVRDLLNERGQIERYADVRAFTSQAPSRLEVLASDRDPTVSVAFSEADYGEVSRVLEHYYSICLTDCGTGLLHSAMAGVLRLADQIVLVSSPSVDGARSASATLDWLAAHAYEDLVRGAVVVLSIVRSSSRSTVDLDRLEQHFAARCRAVTRIPYDPHLEEGAEVELDQLSRTATDAYLGLAAIVGDGLAWPRNAAQHGAVTGTA